MAYGYDNYILSYYITNCHVRFLLILDVETRVLGPEMARPYGIWPKLKH